MLDQVFKDLAILQIPMRNRFRGVTIRETAIFRGSHGWSEFGAFTEYNDQESSSWLKAALEAANKPWPALFRERVAINATLPIVAPAQVAGILNRFPGCTTVKMKVDDFSNGSEVLEEVLNINPDYKIRLDVNAGWDVDTAISNLLEYHLRFGNVFDYVEQPCESLPELARVKAESPIRIAADESIRKHLGEDFSQIKLYADVAILKWQPVGGFDDAHRIAKEIGLPVVVSSALETGIGISHGLALAASFEESDFACGLGTVALFEDDVCEPAVIPIDGYLEVKRHEPHNHERYLANSQRTTWWHERILRVWELIERGEK